MQIFDLLCGRALIEPKLVFFGNPLQNLRGLLSGGIELKENVARAEHPLTNAGTLKPLQSTDRHESEARAKLR
jgi:hypothetical protein